jgi:hypothetical protein
MSEANQPEDAAPSSTEPATEGNVVAAGAADPSQNAGQSASSDVPAASTSDQAAPDATMADVGLALKDDAATMAEAVKESLIARAEDLAKRAFDTGLTEEHNVMAWIHSHLTGARAIVQGAEQLSLSAEAKAVLAEIKSLL